MFAELIRAGLQALIEAEATAALGTGRYERTEERTNYRNGDPAQDGCHDQRGRRSPDSEAAFWVVLPEPARARRRIDQALHAVIMEAYVHGVLDPQRR